LINLTPTQAGGITTLMVVFQITHQAETQRVINQLNQIVKFNNKTITIKLQTKDTSISTKSMLKEPVVADGKVSEVLAIAERCDIALVSSAPSKAPIQATSGCCQACH